MSKPVLLDEAVVRYLEVRFRKVAPNTYKNDETAMAVLANTLGRKLPLEELTRELFEEKFFGPTGVAYRTSAATFNSYLSRMRRFTVTAAGYGWIDRDPLAGATGRRREATPERRILEPAELLDLVEAARSPRDRFALALAVNTGLRASEIVSLRVADVNMAEGYIHISVHKTVDVDRLPITADLHAELVRWFSHYKLWTDEGEIHPDWYLVPQHNYAPRTGAGRDMDYKLQPHKQVSQPYDIVKRALESMGLPTSQEGFHTIRRSVGRAYYEYVKPEMGHESALVATAALLHHKDIRQTLHYIGVRPERQQRDELLRGKPFLTALARPALTHIRHLRAVEGQ